MISSRIIASSILLLFVLVASVTNCFSGQIGISTGPTNLAYYAVGNDIKNACPTLNINIYESKGGLSNIGNMFTRNEIQYGIAPLDTLMYKDLLDSGKMSKVVAIMPLYKNAIQVIANNRSGIKKGEDLRGKRVNIGPVGSGSWVAAQLYQLRTGYKFIESTFSTGESLKKVLAGELDAAFYFSGVPTPDLVSLGKDGDGLIHLVNMSHPKMDNFTSKSGRQIYELTEIPENTYAWEHNAVQVQQVQNYLIAYNYSSAEKQTDVANLVECIKMNLPKLQEEGNLVWRGVDLGTEVKWPMHPIAKQILGR